MGNLFSSFDPQARVLFISLGLNWVSCVGGLLLIPQLYWLTPNQLSQTISLILKGLSTELRAIFGGLSVPGLRLIFLSFFLFILRSNVLGLLPYVFTSSRHLVFTLTLSLPLWLGSIVWSVILQFNRIIAHLVPLGTPAPLIPIIVIIETVRSLIRPLTLAVRLAANIIAGHLLLALLGGQGSTDLNISICLLIVALVLLLVLECAVACIQSYVFTILSSLYLNELIRVEFTKKYL